MSITNLITLELPAGSQLGITKATALQIHQQLTDILGLGGSTSAVILGDDDPAWAKHSGEAGHDGPEWLHVEEADAGDFYGQLKGLGKLFFDTLLDHPGQQLSVEDIITITGGKLKSRFSIAGAINGLRLAHEASGRRYPFYWWSGSPSTRYAVKPSVAALFNKARGKQGG